MKKLLMLGLSVLGGVAGAQTYDVDAPEVRILIAQADTAKAESNMKKDAARQEADEARIRADLEKARGRLDEAMREVAELSTKLAHDERREFVWIENGEPRRAMLGVQVDPASGKEGARLLSVSPGGAAAEAGLVKGDVIVSLDGKTIPGGSGATRAVVDYMRTVKPEQKVKVKVVRAGKNKDFVVAARPAGRAFNFAMPNMEHVGPMVAGAMPRIREFRAFWPGSFGGMELASITPKLGAYFGVNEGVLVVQAPKDAAFKLEDGDVVQSIDGRKPEDGAHALRILRSYKTGEKLNLTVLRQRKPMTLAVTMPERPEFEDHFMDMIPPEPPEPPMPAVPAVPAVPAQPRAPGGGAGA
jgi:S1-C subfamily serine protease